MLLCRMTSLIDEDCGGEEDADALIEVATSGLPAVQVERLLRRREVMLGIPRELRRAFPSPVRHVPEWRMGAA